MTSLSKQLDVKKLDDIIALIALYRPGPMELIPEYVKAKKGITLSNICIRCSKTSAPTRTA